MAVLFQSRDQVARIAFRRLPQIPFAASHKTMRASRTDSQ
jgi:hypothetical protein